MADPLETLKTQAARHDLPVKGKTMPYLSMNGNMFAFVAKDVGLCMRIPDSDRAEYGADHDASDVLQYGRVMREYVRVDPEMPDLDQWFDRCVAHAKSLKPKPTKRRK